MLLFGLPKTIRWILYCAVIFLLLMSLYRWGIYTFFTYYVVKDGELPIAFGAGFRFDARVIGAFSLLMLLLSFWPSTHFFKTDTGRNTALFLYLLFTAALLVFYAADTVSLFVFKTRLNGAIISDLAKNTAKGQQFKHGAPWLAIFLSIAATTWLIFLVVKGIHGRINKKASGRDNRLVRIYWQVLVILLCMFGIYGRFGKQYLNSSLLAQKVSLPAVQLALNPFESFFGTLPKASG